VSWLLLRDLKHIVMVIIGRLICVPGRLASLLNGIEILTGFRDS
jgi:hypothetical protein